MCALLPDSWCNQRIYFFFLRVILRTRIVFPEHPIEYPITEKKKIKGTHTSDNISKINSCRIQVPSFSKEKLYQPHKEDTIAYLPHCCNINAHLYIEISSSCAFFFLFFVQYTNSIAWSTDSRLSKHIVIRKSAFL